MVVVAVVMVFTMMVMVVLFTSQRRIRNYITGSYRKPSKSFRSYTAFCKRGSFTWHRGIKSRAVNRRKSRPVHHWSWVIVRGVQALPRCHRRELRLRASRLSRWSWAHRGRGSCRGGPRGVRAVSILEERRQYLSFAPVAQTDHPVSSW